MKAHSRLGSVPQFLHTSTLTLDSSTLVVITHTLRVSGLTDVIDRDFQVFAKFASPSFSAHPSTRPFSELVDKNYGDLGDGCFRLHERLDPLVSVSPVGHVLAVALRRQLHFTWPTLESIEQSHARTLLGAETVVDRGHMSILPVLAQLYL